MPWLKTAYVCFSQKVPDAGTLKSTKESSQSRSGSHTSSKRSFCVQFSLAVFLATRLSSIFKASRCESLKLFWSLLLSSVSPWLSCFPSVRTSLDFRVATPKQPGITSSLDLRLVTLAVPILNKRIFFSTTLSSSWVNNAPTSKMSAFHINQPITRIRSQQTSLWPFVN